MVRFDRNVLALDLEAEITRISAFLRQALARKLNRRGAVIAVSGGVDSAVCALLAARALGPERVFALLMPEQDSSDGSTQRGRELCERAQIACLVENITSTLAALSCYERRDRTIRDMLPDYSPACRLKITLADNLLDHDRFSFFNLTVQYPDGRVIKQRMPLEVYLGIVAATNMKQRTRKLLEYYHAERLNYAVIGTPNRLEYDLGFFVRGGDGLADVKPIAHLYKTQVYALARHLGAPESICTQLPTTDTYSLSQTQEEFYYGLPYDQVDLMLYAFRNEIPAAQAAEVLSLTTEQVERIYRDLTGKRRMADRLHAAAIVLEE